MTAAGRWAEQLAAWAIPEEVLAAAPVSPWGFAVGAFADRARRHRERPTPAHALAREPLADGGRVLDVGCGGGAGSLPLVPPATGLTGFDSSPDMLASYRESGSALGVEVETVEGSWPEDAELVADDSHEVVVAQDVLYNVPDVAGFLRACDRVATRRVVVVLPPVHPMAWTTPYWQRLHGIDRPDGPTVDDAVAVLDELGIVTGRTTWSEPTLWQHADLEEAVTMVRIRLCLPASRDDDVRRALVEVRPPTERRAVALWWDVAG